MYEKNKSFLDVAYRFYSFLVKLKCPFDAVIWLFNLGICMFMMSNVVYVRMFYKLTWYFMIFAAIPILLFIYLNSPGFSWRLYIYINSYDSVFRPGFKENITLAHIRKLLLC